MKVVIKQEDLDKALGTPWATTTCLLAQAIMRTAGINRLEYLSPQDGRPETGGRDVGFTIGGEDRLSDPVATAARHAQHVFDVFRGKGATFTLDDVKKAIGLEFEVIGLEPKHDDQNHQG